MIYFAIGYKLDQMVWGLEKLSKERIERFNEKGIPLMSIREIHKMETWLKYADTYVEYLEKYGEQPGAAYSWKSYMRASWQRNRRRCWRGCVGIDYKSFDQ